MYRALIKKRIYERVTDSRVVTLPMVLLGTGSGMARHNVTLRCRVAVTLPHVAWGSVSRLARGTQTGMEVDRWNVRYAKRKIGNMSTLTLLAMSKCARIAPRGSSTFG